MSLRKCIKKLGLGKHESAIMRALVREHYDGTRSQLDAARLAVKQRLDELRREQKSVNEQIEQAIIIKEAAAQKVEAASKQAAHSPDNSKKLPTNAQKEAGNYAKGHLNVLGFDITIENPKGSTRSGMANGEPWSVKMQVPYGYIRRTEGADGEQVDVYLGDQLTEDSPVFVIDQIDPATKNFDEHKVILGTTSFRQAKNIYDDHFADDSGESRRAAMTKMSLDEFKQWLKSGNSTIPVKYKEPPRTARTDPFLLWVKDRGGINIKYAEELTGEKAFRANSIMPGLFKTPVKSASGVIVQGQGLDEIAIAAMAEGWLERTDDLNDGGVIALTKKLRAALSGERQSSLLDEDAEYRRLRDQAVTEESFNEEEQGLADQLSDEIDEGKLIDIPPASKWARMSSEEKENDTDRIFGESTRTPFGPQAVHAQDGPEGGAPEKTTAAKTGRGGQAQVAEQKRTPYDPNQAELVYDNFPTRPGTTPEQKSLGIAALKGLFFRDRNAGATILGSRLWNDFSERGGAELLGQQVKNAKDLGTLAQILRDPRFEKMRVFFTKDNVLVDHIAWSSRNPGSVSFVVEGRVPDDTGEAIAKRLDQLAERMTLLGADGYWLMHNHPSGSSQPSDADIALTENIDRFLPGFKGHVVIDHNEFSEIDAKGRVSTYGRTDKEPEHAPEVPHALLGRMLSNNKQLDELAHELQTRNDMVVLIATDAQNRVHALAEMPRHLLKYSTPRERLMAMARIHHFMKGSGAGGRSFIVAKNVEALRGLVTDNVVTIVTDGNRVLYTANQERMHSKAVWAAQQRVADFGDLTNEQVAAIGHIHGSPKTWAQKLGEFSQDWKKNLVQGIFDQFAPIFEYSAKAYRLARMSKGGDGTLEAVLMYGKPYVDRDGAYRVKYSKVGGMKGFANVLAGLHGEHDRFLEWVAANRAERLASIGLENLYRPQDIAALKKLADGKMADGTQRQWAYDKALRELNDWNDAVLKIAVDSGLISDETRQTFKDQPYVPFYRLADEGVINGYQMTPGIVNQYAWKKLKGGTGELNADLLANVLQNWSHLLSASAKNRAAKETLEAAVKAGTAVEVPASAPGKLGAHQEGNVSFNEGGKERSFVLSDPFLMDAISALHYAGLGAWSKPFTTMKRWLTTGVTANPSYKIRNLIRDSIQSVASAKLSPWIVPNLVKGYKATAEDSETRAQLLAAGGIIRFGSMLDGTNADRTRRLIEKGIPKDQILDSDGAIKRFWKHRMLPVWESYQEIGDRGEQVNRAALYERLMAKGMSHEEAAFWARDLMDFNSHGKWAAVRVLTQVVPFMNARLQGLYKLGRATKQDVVRMGSVITAVSLASIALLLEYEDDEDWKKREPWDRDNYWWFKIGGMAFRIPRPFEIGAIGSIAERTVELAINDEFTGAQFGQVVRDIVLNQLAMNPTPQLIKPMMDLYANKDSFTGRPIESAGMERLRKEDRVTERTSEVAKVLGSLGLPDPSQLVMGRWNTLSPVQIDALVRGYFSWLGVAATTVLDYGIRPAINSSDRPDMKLRDVFVLGNFAETLPANQSRYVTQLYQQAVAIEQAYASYNDARKRGDLELAAEIKEDEADKLRKHHLVEKAKRRLSDINRAIKVIESSAMAGSEKRLRIDALNQLQHEVARGALLQ